MGDSIDHWEGQTLVVDTIARKPGRLVPELPIPMVDFSERAHFVERLHLVDHDTMQNDMTIEDPSRFAHPWHLRIRYRRVKGLDRMITGGCAENNRNAVVNGKMIILPP